MTNRGLYYRTLERKTFWYAIKHGLVSKVSFKTFVRGFVCLAMVFFIFSLIGMIFSRPKADSGEPVAKSSVVQMDMENGFGGPSYPESTVVKVSMTGVSMETEGTGIPEPVEYSRPHVLLFSVYKVQKGDTISGVALNFGLNQDTLISVNNIKNSRGLQINQVMQVPNQDGIIYTVKKGDTLSSIAGKYETDVEMLQTVNELFSPKAKVNATLFIPGARLPEMDLQEINGDLFQWPVRGRLSSRYGYRSGPFGGSREFHSGMDIAVPMGTPVRAAMAGQVIETGFDRVYGNYVVVRHHSTYRTLYGHLSKIRTRAGAYVGTNDYIGNVGSTGRSTGPHLHFTVYKNGVTVNPAVLITR
jgi:murein DD-endopeptidase MepM/ murein hydrolase activator NlpD